VKYIIGVAEMKVSDCGGDILTTHALGSCLGVAVHDPVACVGGLLHVMLPLSTIAEEKGREKPAMFIDTGLPRLFVECYGLGAKKSRMIVKAAGGAHVGKGDEDDDMFRIGRRNATMLRKLLWRNGVLLDGEDLGGTCSRTMTLAIGSGEVTIKANGDAMTL